jgi:hypothetical protein
MATKYFCDGCNQEVKNNNDLGNIDIPRADTGHRDLICLSNKEWQLCLKCIIELNHWLEGLCRI